jgi:poly-gamma-glutamate synthesis protein (capsule biosynthesis protein)
MGVRHAAQGSFTGVTGPVPDAVFERMQGRSWVSDDARCPPRDALAYLQLDHRTLDGGTARGELIVAHRIADETLALFRRLWAIGFPIARMTLIDELGADDLRSMAADNSSGFNFRVVAGTTELSQHALGLAIDLNPVENPWVQTDRFVPAVGAPFLDRTALRAGMIVRPGPVVRILDELGWEWGGDWKHARDYHHIVWRR